VVCLATSAALLGGCTHQVTYGYSYQLKEDLFGGEEDPEPAPVEARQLLAAAKTVAFFPPDTCINADPTQDRKRLQELRASCGVLMSKLERAAQGAGYEVLSWQNLRGGKRPIDYARESNVDVLFEINEFEPNTLQNSQIERTLTFFERSSGGSDTPIPVTTDIAQKCRGQEPAALRNEIVALTGAIDIKTVSVVDGRDRWHYRKTEARSLGKGYQPQFYASQTRPHWSIPILGTTAILAGIAGGGLVIADAFSEDNPLTPMEDGFSSGGWGRNLLIIGGLAAIGAIVVGVMVPGSKPDPNEILCEPLFYVPPAASAPAAPNYASVHSFQETRIADVIATRKREIQDDMIKEFVALLKEVKAARPAEPPPAPPADPATVPAPAPTPQPPSNP
jgi:hypothetical protein